VSFKSIADPLIKRGVSVVIAAPGDRNSFVKDWHNLATTDQPQVDKWNEENPNYNCISVAKYGGDWLLDCDDYAACVAAGMPDLAATDIFCVKSPSDGACHFYFVQDDVSRLLRNGLNIHNAEGKLIAEIKLNNLTCCSPGSVREDGGEYILVETNLGIAPTTLTDWVVAMTPEEAPRVKGQGGLHEDFEPVAVLEHCEFETTSREARGKTYFPQDSCFLCGHTSERWDKITWILTEGVKFVFCCVYCDSAHKQKDVWEKLREDYDPYPGPIWAGWHEDNDDWMDDLEECSPIENVEECYQPGCLCDKHHPPGVWRGTTPDFVSHPVAEQEEPVPQPAPVKDDLSGEELLLAVSAGRMGVKPKGKILTMEEYLGTEPAPIPATAMYGKMKVWAEQTDLPLSVSYLAVLTAYSAIPKQDEMLGCRINLYGTLLMPVGWGKNLTLTRSAKVLNMVGGLDYQDCTIGGDGGLWQALGDKKEGRSKDATIIKGPRKILLNPAEFGATLENTRIDGSTLSQHLCNLWDKSSITLPTREGVREINCRPSILGALPIDAEALEQFSRYFAEEASHGLYSRFLFGFSKEKIDTRWAERWQMRVPDDGTLDGLVPELPSTKSPLGWEESAENFYSSIVLPDDGDGRGLYNLKRIAILTAAANQDEYVTLDAVQAAWFFMLWQAQLKRSFRVGQSQKTTGGELSGLIMAKLRAIDAKGFYSKSPVIDGRLNINLARVISNHGWTDKYGAEPVNRTLQALVKLGQLAKGSRLSTQKKVVDSDYHFRVQKHSA